MSPLPVDEPSARRRTWARPGGPGAFLAVSGDHLASLLRGLAAGRDPAQLVHEAMEAAVTTCGAGHGLVVALVDGTIHPLATSGAPAAALGDVAAAATRSAHLTRGTTPDGLAVVAVPVVTAGRIVGAIAVGGLLRDLEVGGLQPLADVVSIVLSHRARSRPEDAGAGAAATPEALQVAAWVARGASEEQVLARALEAAAGMLGARAGFASVLRDGTAVLTQARGIPRDRLAAGTANPAARLLLASPATTVTGPDHPVAEILGPAHLLVVPVPAGHPLGHLGVLLDEAPGPVSIAALEALAVHASLGLRAARLASRATAHDERLASVVHSLPNPVVVVDAEGRFTLVNAAAGEALGLATDFEVGQACVGRIGHPILEGLLAPVPDPMTAPTASTSPGRAVDVVVGSPPRAFRATVRPVRSGDGTVTGRVLVLDDVTAERDAERTKADFTAVIGHELRTPLTVMRGYLSTLQRRGDRMDAATRIDALQAVDGAARRLQHLVEDLLFVSAVETRPPSIDRAAIDLAELLAPWQDCGGGRIDLDLPLDVIVISSDRQKLEQIIRHLVANALEYSDGCVGLCLRSVPGEVRIAVSDHGPGIWSGDIPRLFERFHQLDGTATRAHGGTGIGLYVCRRLAELLGGRVECQSRLGVGSTFTLALPR